MSADTRLRTAARAGDAVAVLRWRLRSGDVSQERVELAARLGREDAQAICDQPGVEWGDWSVRRDLLVRASGAGGRGLAQAPRGCLMRLRRARAADLREAPARRLAPARPAVPAAEVARLPTGGEPGGDPRGPKGRRLRRRLRR